MACEPLGANLTCATPYVCMYVYVNQTKYVKSHEDDVIVILF